jgi:hypothetical protein
MSDTPLWRIWRDAEAAATDADGPETIEQMEAAFDAARIESLRGWLFPGGEPPQPWAVAEFGIWQRLTLEAERCRGKASAGSIPTDCEGGAETPPTAATPGPCYRCQRPEPDAPADQKS